MNRYSDIVQLLHRLSRKSDREQHHHGIHYGDKHRESWSEDNEWHDDYWADEEWHEEEWAEEWLDPEAEVAGDSRNKTDQTWGGAPSLGQPYEGMLNLKPGELHIHSLCKM